jgi:hypothetical protein
MIRAVVSFREATITQRAAFFRVVYGISFMLMPMVAIVLGLRWHHIPFQVFSGMFHLMVMSSITSLSSFNGKPLVANPSVSNWDYATGFIVLSKEFFGPSPHSKKVSYRIFRGILGFFVFVIGILLFTLMLPLVILEMVWSGMESVRKLGRYAPFIASESTP